MAKILRKSNKKKVKRFKLRLRTKIKLILFSILCIMVTLLYIYILLFEREIVPLAIEISEKYATNIVSQEINESVSSVIDMMNLDSGKFLNKSSNNNTNSIDVDTILINEVCLNVSSELSKNMQEIKDTKIDLPIGVFTGVSAFSGVGPPFTIYVTSLGNATVDYETHFESVGINQINFQIYLNINTTIGIVNPVYNRDMHITRKLMLVNTIYNGEVPNTYLNWGDE